MYEEVADHPSHLIDVMHKALEKIPKRGDLDINTLKYFDLSSPNSENFISCPKHPKSSIEFQIGPLSLTLAFTPKIFLNF